MRIVIVGAGPGGLYLSMLLKRSDRDRDVVVLERNRADDVFGFGVVFSDKTMSSLEQDDPEITDTLGALGPAWDAIEVRLRDETLRCGGIGFTSVARSGLLAVLRRRARDAGVEVRFGTRVSRRADIPDHDLLVGADGVNSTVRGWQPRAFGYRPHVGDAKFIWLGTTRRFDCLTFLFEQTEYGAFGVHAYPFDADTSTFLVETDPATWRAAGLDGFDPDRHPSGASDERSVAFLREVFAGTLEGHELLASNSRWLSFTTVRNARWWHDATVLIGDAAHTAHFSVGSGTRMAMEDALALSRALDRERELAAALRRYEADRRPAVERIQTAAEPSQRWWERFGIGVRWPIERFAFHFLTRTPRITRGSLRRRDPRFVAAVDDWWRRTPDAAAPWPANAEATQARVVPPTDEAGRVEEAEAVARAADAVRAGAERIVVEAPRATAATSSRRRRWGQLVVSERIRAELEVPTLVVRDAAGNDLATTVIEAGRADAVSTAAGVTTRADVRHALRRPD